MFRRASEISAFTLCLILLANYVGGLGLSLVFGASIALWILFSAYSVLPSHSRFLGALILGIIQFLFIHNTVVPVLRSFIWFHDRMLATIPVPVVDYIQTASTTSEVIHPWVFVLLMSFATVCVLPIVMLTHRSSCLIGAKGLRARIKFRAHAALSDTQPAVSRFVLFIPLIAISTLQYVNPVRAVTFIMSGDSRNIFLLVMRTRLNGSFPSFTNILNTGRLGETLATSLTVTNGTTGYPKIADLYAIRSVYILMMCLVVCSIAVLVTSFYEDAKGCQVVIQNTIVMIISVAVFFSPYPFAEILRSGFFSLFTSIGFVVSAVAFIVPKKILRKDVLFLAITCVVLTFMSYQLAGLILLPTIIVVGLLFLWSSIQYRVIRVAFCLCAIAVSVFVGFNMQQIFDRFVTRVTGGGAVEPTGIALVGIVFVAAVAIVGVVNSKTRYVAFCAAGISGGSLLVMQFIFWSRKNDPDLYGYYGFKLAYATNFVAFFLMFTFFGSFLSYLFSSDFSSMGRKRLVRQSVIFKSFVAVVFSFVLIGICFYFPRAESPVLTIRNGWGSPSESIVEKTLAYWNSGQENYIFANFATDSNDRLANFWSPFFWEPNRWEWTYSGYDISPLGLCQIIDGKKMMLVTASDDLARKTRGMCPTAMAQMTVEK